MKDTRFLAPALLTLILPVLSACGGGGKSTEPVVPPAVKTYNLRNAVLELYGKPHSWDMQGTLCCTDQALKATLTLQPRPSDGGTFTINGENATGVDITLQMSIPSMPTVPASASTAHLWYSAQGQQLLRNGLAENRQEVTTSQGSLPTSAVPGDTGGNGESSNYEQGGSVPRLISSISRRWELKKDSKDRILMCLNSVETPDPAYAGSNPALAAKTTVSTCYGLNADSTLSGYVSTSQVGFNGMGWTLSTQ